MAESAQVVVVGAGAAGLAVAGQLAERGIGCTVLEAQHEVGAAWRRRYESLRLHTDRRLSGLPGMSMPKRFGQWVKRDDLVDYLDGYARFYGIEPEFGVEVRRIERVGERWQVTTSVDVRGADAVVVATGNTRVPRLPDWPGRDDFPGSLIHAVDYREPSAYAGRRVLVVGSGNTGAEIAVELTSVAAEVAMSVRTPPNIVPRSTLGVPSQLIGLLIGRGPEPVINPLNAALRRITVPDLTSYGLPAPPGNGFSQFKRSRVIPILDHGFVDAVRDGRIRIVPAVTSFAGGQVRLSDDRTIEPEMIIAATGFRPGLESMVDGLGVLDDDGVPRARGGDTLPGAPQLYFVGISSELGGLLRQVGQEARQVAARISPPRAAAG